MIGNFKLSTLKLFCVLPLYLLMCYCILFFICYRLTSDPSFSSTIAIVMTSFPTMFFLFIIIELGLEGKL